MKREFMRDALRLFAALWLAILPTGTLMAGGFITANSEAQLNNALVGGGFVSFLGNFNITLTTTKNITNDTTLYAFSYDVTLNGNNAVRMFNVSPGVTLEIIHVRFVNGRSTNGAAIYNNGGTVFANNSTCSDSFNFFFANV